MMNCEETRNHWELFHDSEGDAELHHRINEHLAMCPGCSRWFYQQSRLEEALAEKLRAGEADLQLWNGIRDRFSSQPASASRSWFFSHHLWVLAVCLMLVAAGIVWYGHSGAARADLTGHSVALHEKLADGREAVAFASRSPLEIEDYLRRQVSFPVRCPPRDDAGFAVDGAGTGKFKNDPVAYVVGNVDGRRVSVFVLPRESLANFPVQFAALRGQEFLAGRGGGSSVVMSRIDRNLVVVVGRLEPGRLLTVLRAYGSYPDHADQTS